MEMGLATRLTVQGEGGRAGREVFRQEFLEEERGVGEGRRLVLRNEAEELVPEGVEAGGLEADDARAASDERRECVERAPRLFPRRVDEAGREEGAAAAKRARAALRLGPMQTVAGGAEHAFGRPEVLRLEIAVEGVAEEHEIAAVAGDLFRPGGAAGLAPRRLPNRHRAAGRETQGRFRGAGGAWNAVAQVEHASQS